VHGPVPGRAVAGRPRLPSSLHLALLPRSAPAVIPTKVYKTGDGMFFQWVLCTAILFTGTICFFIQCAAGDHCPQFEPLAVLGGVLWCTGNILTVPIIKTIGLAMGLVIWGSANLVAGWASGKFGLFGLKPEQIPHPTLNYVGVALALVSLGVSFFLKPTLHEVGEDDVRADLAEDDFGAGASYKSGLLPHEGELGLPRGDGADSVNAYSAQGRDEGEDDRLWVTKLPKWQQQVFGVGASLVAGLLYGVNFDPALHVIAHPKDYPGAPTDASELVFSQFVGIWLASTAYFLVYALVMQNRPVVFPKVILPGFISGVMWAIADICWFIANANLELVVSFPLVTMGPGIIGALWGVFAFREITGTRNYILLTAVFVIAAAGAACIVMSKL